MPLVPIWLIRGDYDRIPRVLRKYVVSRSSGITYENEFTDEKLVQFHSESYPTYNAVIYLDFSQAPTAMPQQNTISATRIKNYGVVPLTFEYHAAERRIIFRADRLQAERIRISWR